MGTTTANNGTYTLTALARDAAGNATTLAPVSVNVANAGGAPAPISPTPQIPVTTTAIPIRWPDGHPLSPTAV